MFDFQKLSVYQKSLDFNKEIAQLIAQSSFDKVVTDQLKRASLSIMLNIAESSSRFSNKDRRNMLVISRGSAFECVAIFEFLNKTGQISDIEYQDFFSKLEEISKMLYALIKKLE